MDRIVIIVFQGKAGYNREIFNDDRGQLTGQAYGTRVLGPGGDSTNYGGRLDWANKNAQAAIDINRQIGGRSGVRFLLLHFWAQSAPFINALDVLAALE